MDYQIADSRTWQPFKIERSTKKARDSYKNSLLTKFFQRLGFRPKPDDTTQPNMKLVTITVPCMIKGKYCKKGTEVQVEDLKAAELIGMKVAELKGSVETPPKPWERVQPKESKKESAEK